MRNAIILSDYLEYHFLAEAEKFDFVKFPYRTLSRLEENEILNDRLEENDRQNLFRTLLLYDDIILTNANKNDNYDKLKDTGMFSIFCKEDVIGSEPIHKDDLITNATYLKPAILPGFKMDMESYFIYGEAVDGFSNFVSDLYDCILISGELPSKHLQFFEINKNYFDKTRDSYIERLEAECGHLPDEAFSNRFLFEIQKLLFYSYTSLRCRLEISSKKDAAIIDCPFDLANIGCEKYTKDFSNRKKAYNILKVECGNIIGTLPQMNTFQDVLRLKETRRRDIHNLKQELSRLEYEIRNGNSIKAAEQAAKDIEKASKALSKGINYVSQVKKWTNVFATSIEVADLFNENSLIKIGAGVLKLVGLTASVVETVIKDKNQWFQVIF